MRRVARNIVASRSLLLLPARIGGGVNQISLTAINYSPIRVILSTAEEGGMILLYGGRLAILATIALMLASPAGAACNERFFLDCLFSSTSVEDEPVPYSRPKPRNLAPAVPFPRPAPQLKMNKDLQSTAQHKERDFPDLSLSDTPIEQRMLLERQLRVYGETLLAERRRREGG